MRANQDERFSVVERTNIQTLNCLVKESIENDGKTKANQL